MDNAVEPVYAILTFLDEEASFPNFLHCPKRHFNEFSQTLRKFKVRHYYKVGWRSVLQFFVHGQASWGLLHLFPRQKDQNQIAMARLWAALAYWKDAKWYLIGDQGPDESKDWLSNLYMVNSVEHKSDYCRVFLARTKDGAAKNRRFSNIFWK